MAKQPVDLLGAVASAKEPLAPGTQPAHFTVPGMAKQPVNFLGAVASAEGLLFPDEPTARFTAPDVDRFLVWASEVKASDITVQHNEQIFLEIAGRFHRVTRRALSKSEVFDFMAHIFQSESIKGRLSGPDDADFSYDLRPDRDRRYRFRVNCVAGISEGISGAQITLRTIPSKPPLLSEMALEQTIIANIAPRQGLILIAGATGSGKTTLLASIIRHLAEDPEGHRKIITFESPIEYVFDEINHPTTSIFQTEIDRNLPSFLRASRNALRRKPTIIMLGEARDAETMTEVLVAAMTGHLVYTTVHTNGFAETIRRIVALSPPGEAHARTTDIVMALRMVVCQTLVMARDGRRIALREFVIMTPEIVEKLLRTQDLDRLSLICKDIVEEHGQTFLADARIKFSEGKIDRSVLRTFEYASQANALDASALAHVAPSIAKHSEDQSQEAPDTAAQPPVNLDPRLSSLPG